MLFWRKKKKSKTEIEVGLQETQETDNKNQKGDQDSKLITEAIVVNKILGRFDIVLEVIEIHTDDVISLENAEMLGNR